MQNLLCIQGLAPPLAKNIYREQDYYKLLSACTTNFSIRNRRLLIAATDIADYVFGWCGYGFEFRS